MKHWHLTEKQLLFKEIFKEPPLISYKRGGSLKDILVRSKLWEWLVHVRESRAGLSTYFYPVVESDDEAQEAKEVVESDLV